MSRRLYSVRPGPAIPAALLRIALALVGVVAAFNLTDVRLWQVLLVIGGLGAAIVPRSFVPWILLLLLAVTQLFEPATVPRTCMTLLLVHATQVLGTLCYAIGFRGYVTFRALRATAARFLAIQLISQPLAIAIVYVLRPTPGPGSAWFAVLGAAALALLGVWLLRLVNRRSQTH